MGQAFSSGNGTGRLVREWPVTGGRGNAGQEMEVKNGSGEVLQEVWGA